MKVEEIKNLIDKSINNAILRISERLDQLEKQIVQIRNFKYNDGKQFNKLENFNQRIIDFGLQINYAMIEAAKIIQNQEKQQVRIQQTKNISDQYLENLQSIFINIKSQQINTQFYKQYQQNTNHQISTSQQSVPSISVNSYSTNSNYQNKIKNEVTVYATKSGRKYHNINCEHLQFSKIPVSKYEAEANGLTPCGWCFK